MDERLVPAHPAAVRSAIAGAYLDGPAVDPALGDIRLEPHQVDAAARVSALLAREGGALLADATGLGKTFVAIAVARAYARPLVVAPAALRHMWHHSLGRCEAVADVVSYESLGHGVMPNRRPDLLILDEAHHARNPGTRRYAALADLAWGAHVVLLTATPVHNRLRDLQALLALFLGSGAHALAISELNRLVVRRTRVPLSRSGAAALPAIERPSWISIPHDPATLHAIADIPPAVPAADGSTAHALLQLGLLRAWCSSEAALRETLRRRLRRASAFMAAIEEGRVPTRRELDTWLFIDDAVQLGFPLALTSSLPDADAVRSAIERHSAGVQAVLAQLDRHGGQSDRKRIAAFERVVRSNTAVPVVAFTQFADTAAWLFRSTNRLGGVALVSGRGARIASGSVSPEAVTRGFDVEGARREERALPLHVLIATDVLSEGLSLRRAGVLVHIDLPWTAARLEQRVGRLRRLGSPHARIAVFAIGPPASARELAITLRALQRKARLSSGISGATELDTILPLSSRRLAKALAGSRRSATVCDEELRALLSRWQSGVDVATAHREGIPQAIVLLEEGPTRRLLSVNPSCVSEDSCEVLDTARAVSGISDGVASPDFSAWVAARVGDWQDAQRGRELADLTAGAQSPAHLTVLARLAERLHRAPRAERYSLGTRIARLRSRVGCVRGVGVERALQSLLDHDLGIDLDALERLLESRGGRTDATGTTRLIAMVGVQPDGTCVAAASPALAAHRNDG